MRWDMEGLPLKGEVNLRPHALKPLFKPILGRIRQQWPRRWRYLDIDERLFRPFKEPLMSTRVATTRFYNYSDHGTIAGWMSPPERQILYALARWLPGPIVEIGSWLGLSTTAIARGIRDSGHTKRFDTFDLKLAPDMYRPVENGMAFFLSDDPTPLWINTNHHYQNEILPIISKPGGSNKILRSNLARAGLSKFVTDHVGDFKCLPAHACRWVFCDTLHDLREIEANASYLRRFLAPNSILACHDMGSSPELIAALRRKIPLGYGTTIDTLFVAEGCN